MTRAKNARYLVTGGCGFLGSNLCEALLRGGAELTIFDSLGRVGSTKNLEWLKGFGRFRFEQGDIRDAARVAGLVRELKPDVVVHLAGQVALTTSIADPRLDFEINMLGTLNVLEAVRSGSPHSLVCFSSTNKVYGALESIRCEETATRYRPVDFPFGFDESLPLDFSGPYGCSKGAADQYALNYAKIYGLKTVVFRHSTVFGPRQFSTVDQGWVGWFVQEALAAARARDGRKIAIAGDGKQVRDVLYASDFVSCYLAAIEHGDRVAGNVYNIGGGMENSVSLLELLSLLGEKFDVRLECEKGPARPGDQKFFVADVKKAKSEFGWRPLVSRHEGLNGMIDWVKHDLAGR